MDGPEKLEQSELLKTKGTNFFKVKPVQEVVNLVNCLRSKL